MKPALAAAFDAARDVAEIISEATDGIDFDVHYEEMLDGEGQPHVIVKTGKDLSGIVPKTVSIKKGNVKYNVSVEVFDMSKGMN